ncbi:MAG: hybrid sensor histidine kinase/response regulator, partial [Proteobacteria bacterium]
MDEGGVLQASPLHALRLTKGRYFASTKTLDDSFLIALMDHLIPFDEHKRLRILNQYQILDTPPEVAFDRLTQLAAKLFKMPVALVSFIDADRQWLKSCFGTATFEIEREEAFCAHTILSDQVLVVDNLAQDSRFANFLKVIGPPNVRFYAGAPLKARDGQLIGTLCVLDFVPRTLNVSEQEILADLAAIVVDELEMRLAGREMRDNAMDLRHLAQQNHQQAIAIENLRSGVIMTDPHLPDNPIVFANPGFYELTGYSPSEVLGRNCRFLQGPETNQGTIQEMRDAIKAQRYWYGIVLDYHKDGSKFVNEVSITPVFDENNEIYSFVGVQNDVTERENARELLEQGVAERTADLAQSKLEILQ